MADQRFPVEASHILMFARAIGDPIWPELRKELVSDMSSALGARADWR